MPEARIQQIFEAVLARVVRRDVAIADRSSEPDDAQRDQEIGQPLAAEHGSVHRLPERFQCGSRRDAHHRHLFIESSQTRDAAATEAFTLSIT